MSQSIRLVSILVKDYDEAIAFYVDVLGFALIEDTPIPKQVKRWVVVAPNGGSGAQILLVKASNDQQTLFIRNQAGGHVFLFLPTQTILNVITRFIKTVGSSLFGVKFRSLTAQWLSLQTSTEINGT